MRFCYTIEGFDGNDDPWSIQSTLDAPAMADALALSQMETFQTLLQRRKQGQGCGGPYKLTAVTVRLDIGPATRG